MHTGLYAGDDFYFHSGPKGQGLDGKAASGRKRRGKKFRIYFVDGCKVTDVGKVNRGFNDLLQGRASRFQNGPDIGQRGPRLVLDIVRYVFGTGFQGKLARCENQRTSGNGL